MKFSTITLLVASAAAHKLNRLDATDLLATNEDHACDFIDDKGEEISTSLMPEYVQLHEEDEDTTEVTAEDTSSDGMAGGLQGLMTAQSSLHRIANAMHPKPPQADQFQALAGKLEIELTPEILNLGTNEAISNALIGAALEAGKTEDDIAAAMGEQPAQ